MSKSVKFKFEKNLPHQDKAIDSVVSLFSDVDKSIDNIIYSECVDYFRRKNQPDIKERRNIKIINGKKLRENLERFNQRMD